MVGKQERVCVTGAGGYLASWIVKLLLSNGYSVHGTVRDPCDEKKNSHLKKLENSSENLQLFKADLLDYEGLCAAISGCTGVFHVACPVPAARQPNPEVAMIQPALDGTRNVLNACLKAKVRRVVVVSSVSAVMVKSNWPKDQEMDEECWSDVEFCKEVQNYYWLAKTMAEREAWDYSKNMKLEIITVCPSVIIGPKLQATVNASSLFLLRLLTDGPEEVQDAASLIVDVRDVAEALLLVYEKPEAQGRYICTSYRIKMSALAEKIRNMYPNYNGTRKLIEAKLEPYPISSKKLQDLGWKYRALEKTIVDSVKEYQESGILGEN